jgi:hypothetical protein
MKIEAGRRPRTIQVMRPGAERPTGVARTLGGMPERAEVHEIGKTGGVPVAIDACRDIQIP